jgi:hypothetical protein
MVEWLVPVSLFLMLVPLLFGGDGIHVSGAGAAREVAGLMAGFAGYLVIWAVVRAVARGTGVVPSVLIATAVATVLLPFLVRGVLRVLGVRITRTAPHGA